MAHLTLPLDPSHKKGLFRCDQPLLDNYLHTQAKQDVKRKLSACFVLADVDGVIKGYYTLSSGSIPRELIPEDIKRKLPSSYNDLPSTLLGRLAVDINFQGQRLGELLLVDALKRSYYISKEVGSMAVVVDPLNKSAFDFYLKFGLTPLPDSGKMFLEMVSVSALF